MVNYALKLSTVAKYLCASMIESDIVLNIAKYYSIGILETITIRNI